MKKELLTYIYIIMSLLLIPLQVLPQSSNKVRIYGKITDSATKEPLPYTSIRINKTSIGCSSDNKGNFSFYAPALRDTLIISSVGYTDERIPLSSKTKMPIKIALKPTDYQLTELTVKPKKEKYSKKGNPAVTLARTIIEKRDDNSPKNKDFYSRDRHEKLNLALNNFDSENNSHWSSTSTRR